MSRVSELAVVRQKAVLREAWSLGSATFFHVCWSAEGGCGDGMGEGLGNDQGRPRSWDHPQQPPLHLRLLGLHRISLVLRVNAFLLI